MKYVIDIDGTLCKHREDLDYAKCEPFKDRIKQVNELTNSHEQVVLYTGRQEDKREVTEKWLHKYDVRYDELLMNKPIGENGQTLYVDDLAITPEAFFKEDEPVPVVVKKKWGSELIIADNDLYKLKILKINAGTGFHLQYHNRKDETMYIQKGSGYLCSTRDSAYGEMTLVNPGMSFRFKPKTIHKIFAKTNMEIIEVSTPVSDSDVVHLED